MTRTTKDFLTRVFLTRGFLTKFYLGLSLGLLISCSKPANSSGSQAVTPSVSSAANPSTPPQATSAKAPSASTSSDFHQVLGADVTCNAPSHFAKIVWQQGVPYMTFGVKQEANDLDNVAATVIINPDISLTYSTKVNYAFYSRFYPNGNCFVQVLDPTGAVSLEENGNMTINSDQAGN